MALKEMLEKLKGAKNSKGEALNTGALSEEAGEVVLALVNQTTGEITTTLTATTEALAAANAEIKTLKDAAAAAPKGDDPDKDKGKGKKGETGDGDEPPAWFKKHQERLDKIESERANETAAQASARIVKETIESKFANHRIKDHLITEATELGLAKAEDVIKFVEKRNTQLIASGIKAEQLMVDPKAEHAKENDAKGGSEADAKRKESEAIERVGKVPRSGSLAV